MIIQIDISIDNGKTKRKLTLDGEPDILKAVKLGDMLDAIVASVTDEDVFSERGA